MSFIANRLLRRRIWERILRERLSEPLHLNLLSLPVWLLGTTRQKIYFDLIVRQHHAFGLLRAADFAAARGLKSVTALEFGVAAGTGLVNMCKIAQAITKETGISFKIYGFDGGAGMPPPRDYRDHPESYTTGDFPMLDPERLRAALPPGADLVIGEITETAPRFLADLDGTSPIGFVSIDVDYYWSAVEALRIFEGDAAKYLPMVTTYLDDIHMDNHNSWCGELAAVQDFNREHEFRKIERTNFLRQKRLFKRASWIDHMFTLHVLDHSWRNAVAATPAAARVLDNPYLARGAA